MDESKGFKQGLPPIPNNIASITGPGFIGILLNLWLFGVLTLQYYLYYLNFPNDRRLLKFTAHFVFLMELVQTGCTMADGFHRYVFGFGDMNILNEFFLSNLDTPILSGIIAVIVQGMYAWRVYHLSKLKSVTAFIGLCAVAQLAGALGTGIAHWEVKEFSKWQQARYESLQILWTASSAAADILIALTMTWLLLRSTDLNINKETNNILKTILRLTIETNLVSTAVAILVLIMTVTPSIRPPNTYYFMAPGYVLGKLYSNSFMAMLNNRTLLRQDLARSRHRGVISTSRSSQHGRPELSITFPPSLTEFHSRSFVLNEFKREDSEEAAL